MTSKHIVQLIKGSLTSTAAAGKVHKAYVAINHQPVCTCTMHSVALHTLTCHACTTQAITAQLGCYSM